MADNKSKLTIEDYKSDFIFKKKESGLNIQFNRVAFIFFVFFIIYLIYAIHLIHLGSRKDNSVERSNLSVSSNKLYRADIIDINGNYLAKTVKSIDIGLKTSDIINKKKLLLSLNIIFPDKNFDQIEKKIESKKFFYLEKKISEENYEKIMKLGDKSLVPEERVLRMYPQKNLFSHVLGQIDDDNNGISGLEKSLNDELRKSKQSIKLTLDKDIQFLIREELLKYNEIFKALGSAAILMNVNNGEIISIISLPDFNPNERKKINDKNYINRATKGVYELGSVFKTFTFAAALNDEKIDPKTEFKNLKKSIRCGKNIISEYDNKIPSNLTAEQILIRSGNIGSVRIGQLVGIEYFENFLNELNLIKKINFDIDEVGVPIPFNWGKCKLATVSYGHGITTTILQLTNAYSILANGGFRIHPTLIKSNKKLNYQRLLKKNVSNEINQILRKVVTLKEGTASLANVSGYEVGGKTGTAEKSVLGGYSRDKINTFVSIFPASKPKYSLVVMLDEPKINDEYIYNYRDGSGIKYKGTPFNTSGWTSVEVVGQIIEKIGPILATKYNQVY